MPHGYFFVLFRVICRKFFAHGLGWFFQYSWALTEDLASLPCENLPPPLNYTTDFGTGPEQKGPAAFGVWDSYTVDGWNLANQLRLVVYPII